MWKWLRLPGHTSGDRRKLLGRLAATGGVLAAAGSGPAIGGIKDESGNGLRFPGEAASNRVVYQFNKPDEEYQRHVLFSVGALLREYGDNVGIVVTAFGPGIHILLKQPQRPVSKQIRDTVQSLSVYGVQFHACGNTLKALKLTAKDILPFAKYVNAGAADLMALQQQGYAYISW